MSNKSKKPQKRVSMLKAVDTAMTIFFWAWVEEFQPSQEDANRLSAEVRNVRESVQNGNLKLWMVKEQLKDEYGWEI